MRKLKTTAAFRTDLKKLNAKEAAETTAVITKLQKDEPLEPKFRDHDLHGNYEGYRECHIRPDLLLVNAKGSEEKAQMKHPLLLIALLLTLAPQIFPQERPMAIDNSTPKPIELDIDLVWSCKPWIDGKLVTIDGKGRFATIEFFVDKNGKDYAKMSPLCNYPKYSPTNNFWVFPESQTVCVWSSLMMHIFNNKTKKKNSFIPLKSWKGYFDSAFELSPNDLYMHFYYWDVEDNARHIYWTYNQKEKHINDDDIIARISEKLLFQLEPYGKEFLAYETDYKKDTHEYFYYNIENEERRSDDFTKKSQNCFSVQEEKFISTKTKDFWFL